MELVNELLPTGNFRKVDTPFITYSTQEMEIFSTCPLTGNALRKAEM